MTLSEQEKERVRYHLGYLETSFAGSLQFGLPRPMQTLFILEQSMGLLVNEDAVTRVRNILDNLDKIESALMCALPTLQAAQLGNMTLHPLASQGQLSTDSLEKEYVRWGRRLGNIFGVMPYPYSERYRRQGGPGRIVPVRHG